MDAAQIVTIITGTLGILGAAWTAYTVLQRQRSTDGAKVAAASAEVDRARVTASGELALAELAAKREGEGSAMELAREMFRELRKEDSACDEKIDGLRRDFREEIRLRDEAWYGRLAAAQQQCVKEIQKAHKLARSAQAEAHQAAQAHEALLDRLRPYLGTPHDGSPRHPTPLTPRDMEAPTPT